VIRRGLDRLYDAAAVLAAFFLIGTLLPQNMYRP